MDWLSVDGWVSLKRTVKFPNMKCWPKGPEGMLSQGMLSQRSLNHLSLLLSSPKLTYPKPNFLTFG